MKLLKELGLTPMQQLQKEALVISKSLEMKVSKMYVGSAEMQLQKSKMRLEEMRETDEIKGVAEGTVAREVES